jgi:hypothetical protein
MRFRAGVVATVLLALAGAPNAAAAVFTVTRTDDPAPDGCMPMDCSLREAVLDANMAVGPDTILLSGGSFRLTIAGPNDDAGATGDLDLLDNVTVTGIGARLTSIDAQGIDRVLDVADGVTAEIDDVTLRGGETSGDGGGVRAGNSSVLMLRDTITGNRALGDGGGVESSVAVQVVQSTIAGNHAVNGGGIHFAGDLEVSSSTISGNVAGGPGLSGSGGAMAGSGEATAQLGSSTVTGNRAFNPSLSGAGIDVYSTTLQGSIIAENVAHATDQSTSGLANCAQAVTSDGHNLSDGFDCGLGQEGDQEGVPPLLGPLGDNGGPTDTEAVLPGSPALDAGQACPPTDQRSVSRPRGRACDIGAYEFAPPLASTTAATSIAFSSATLTATVDPSLRETTAWFEYGRTTEYGSTTPVRYLGSGNGQMSFTEPLGGLRQGVTYHYRVVAANAEGRALGADQSFTTMDRTKPVLSVLRVVPGLFHRKNGATLAFTLSENATVTFRFDRSLRGVRRGNRCVKITRRNRRRRPCTRYLPVAGSVVQAGAEGPNSIHFDAKVGTKLLAFGAYRLRATPRDAARNVGKTAVAAFRVLR